MVFRVNKNTNYTCMNNVHLRDKRLTLKAKGLLSQMLSLPNDWDYTIDGLVWLNKEGHDAVRSALAELKRNGYLKVTKLKNASNGLYEYQYDIYEDPNQMTYPHIDNPDMESPYMDYPHMDNPHMENHHLNKVLNKQNTDKRNTDERSNKNQGSFKVYTENERLQEAIKAFVDFRKASKKPMTEHAIKLMVDKLSRLASNDDDKIAILNQSILNGWTGIYEVKDDGRTRIAAYRGYTEGKYEPVGNGETVI